MQRCNPRPGHTMYALIGEGLTAPPFFNGYPGKKIDYKTIPMNTEKQRISKDNPPSLAILANKVAKVNNTISERRKKLYQLRRNAATCLSKYNRIYHCGCTPQNRAGIDIMKSEEGKYNFHGVQSCGNVWLCPVCATKIATNRQDEVQRLLFHYLGVPGINIGFLTLTSSHKLTDKFEACKRQIVGGWKKILQSRYYRELCNWYGHKGDIRAMEVKVNKKNGWHIHLHIAVFADTSPQELLRFGDEVIKIWINQQRGRAKKIGQKFSLIYNEKGISDYITKCNTVNDLKWNASHELTMPHLKSNGKVDYETYTPFDLLSDLQDDWKRKKFCAYAHQIKGTRQLTFSKEVRKTHKQLNGDKTDEQLANEKKEGELVMKIDKAVWSEIAYKSLQAYVLDKIQFESITVLILFLLQHDIIAEYDEHKKRLYKVGAIGAFMVKAPPDKDEAEIRAYQAREEFLKIVQIEERDYARANGFYIAKPMRDKEGKILNAGRPIMRYRLHGDPNWKKSSDEWLSIKK